LVEIEEGAGDEKNDKKNYMKKYLNLSITDILFTGMKIVINTTGSFVKIFSNFDTR
jgi:hypothetical protein